MLFHRRQEVVTNSIHHQESSADSNKIKHLRSWQALCSREAQEETMLFTIAVILLVLWLLGLVSGYTLGNFIYVLLVIAIVLFLVRLISGRRV